MTRTTRWEVTARAERARVIGCNPAWYDDDYFAWFDERRPWCHATASALAWRLKPTRILDVGCGYGLMLESWIAAGLDAHGIDVSPQAVGRASEVVKPRIRVVDTTR